MTKLKNSQRYAMHFGLLFATPTDDMLQGLIAATEAAGIPNVDAYYNGDNYYIWGQSPASDIEGYLVELAQNFEESSVPEIIANCSSHLVLYVPKGIHPEHVWEAVRHIVPEEALVPVQAMDNLWGWNADQKASWRTGDGSDLPFSVDEALVWGENPDIAWRTDVRSRDKD